MFDGNDKIKFGVAALFSIVMGFVVAEAYHLKLLRSAPDEFTYDWRTYFLSETARKPRDDIALVLIDENSLTGYNYTSPVDRGLVAELVKFVDASAPKAIGVDLIFDRPTERKKDEALAEALRKARAPIILGAIDSRAGRDTSELDFQETFIAKTQRPAGHLYLGTERNRITFGDSVVRFMLPRSTEPPYRQAFARLLADIDGPKPEPSSPYIVWRHPPAKGGAGLFPTFTVPPHRDVAGNPEGAILPETLRSALRGRFVLIGSSFSDRDTHLTPLTIASRDTVNGVSIHAQILAQLRDGVSMQELPDWVTPLLIAAVIGFGIFAARRWTVKGSGWLSTILTFLAIVGFGALLFWGGRVVAPSATLFMAWTIGLFAGNQADAAGAVVKRIFVDRTTKAGE